MKSSPAKKDRKRLLAFALLSVALAFLILGLFVMFFLSGLFVTGLVLVLFATLLVLGIIGAGPSRTRAGYKWWTVEDELEEEKREERSD